MKIIKHILKFINVKGKVYTRTFMSIHVIKKTLRQVIKILKQICFVVSKKYSQL